MSDGHQVSALARNAAKAERLRQQGAVPVEVSLFDAEALAEVFSGHGAVINLATAIPPMRKFMSARAWAASQRVRTEGSTAVVDAALAAGVARLVQESVVMLYADGGDTWLDEDAPVDRYPMAEGNHADEANTRRFTNAGGDGGDPALRLVLRARRCPQRADAHPSPPPHHHDPRRPSPGPTDTSQAKAQGRTGHQG